MINIKYIKNIISQALNKVDIFYGNISVKAVIDYFGEHKKRKKRYNGYYRIKNLYDILFKEYIEKCENNK